MYKLKVIATLVLLVSGAAYAAPNTLPDQSDIKLKETSLAQAPEKQDESKPYAAKKTFYDSLKETLGVTYFTFFFGPGVQPDSFWFNPNQLGLAEKHGLYFQNNLSLRFKFSTNLALDFQMRFNLLLNNYKGLSDFRTLFWESPRIGISGKLVQGEDWSITGAINTDFPYFLPEPFSGFEVQQRTVILTPGLFAGLSYEPKNSPWSFFSVLSPRFFIYEDRNAAEPSYLTGGYIAQNKPEIILAFQPTISYRLTPKMSITLGAKVDYRKQVISGWNPFEVSMVSNGDSTAWRIAPMPVFIGVTYSFSPALSIFPYLSTYPISAQRYDATADATATLLETTSIGMWLRGTLF